MKYKPFVFLIVMLIPVLLFSCATAPAKIEKQRSFLPLAEGWYAYNFERKTKGIEDEYQFALSTGMKMIEEVTLKQGGTITRFENGVMFDPVLNTYLTIDDTGQIRGRENVSVSGAVGKDGTFFWSGNIEEHGRLFYVSVKGKLDFLPREKRAGSEYNGIYHMTDQGTGREQLVNIDDGFYTWAYTDGEETGFTPWPTLVNPDGSFGFSLEMATVLAMGDFSRADYSTGFESTGKVIPGENISMETLTHTTGMGSNQDTEAPQIYSGIMLHAGEYPNEAVPSGVETISTALASAVKSPVPDWSRYPSWYRDPPSAEGYIRAAGAKFFSDEAVALVMAEAAAAADIAMRLRVSIESETIDIQNNAGSRTESLAKLESLERLPYRVIQREYRKDLGAGFVLAELNLAQATLFPVQ